MGAIRGDDELHGVASRTASALLSATLEHPFGPESDVYKVGGRMFLLLGEHEGRAFANAKADPEDVTALVSAYEGITRGYHMSKRHWVTMRAGRDVDADLLSDVIKGSYEIVAASIPAARRPLVTTVTYSTESR